ncbi:MAG: hypothetical protein RRY40_03730, partial [Oscillospiraceae bacterium]
ITIRDGMLVSDRINEHPAYLLTDEEVAKKLALPDSELTTKHLEENKADPGEEQAEDENSEEEVAAEEEASPKTAENLPDIKANAISLIKADLKQKNAKIKNFKNKLTSKGKGEKHES